MTEKERKALIRALQDPYTSIDVLAVFKALPEADKANKALVLAAVSRDAYVLAFVPDQFKRDPEVVLAAVQTSATALLYASVILRDNVAFNIQVMEHNGKALAFAWDVFKKHPAIAKAACAENINAFWHISSKQVQANILNKSQIKAWANIRRNADILCQGVAVSPAMSPGGFFSGLPEQSGRDFVKDVLVYSADQVLSVKQAEQAVHEAVSKARR